MKFLGKIVFYFILSSSLSLAFRDMDEEVVEGFRHADVVEGEGFWTEDAYRGAVNRYVVENWRDVLNDLDDFVTILNRHIEGIGGEPRSASEIKAVFATACQFLEPVEYVKCLSAWVDLYERGEIDPSLLRNALLTSGVKKNYFLMVNYSHPDVKNLMERAIRVAGSEPELRNFKEFLERAVRGENADAWRYFDDPFPQTMPGIRLKKPFGMSSSDRRWRDYLKQWERENQSLSVRTPSGGKGASAIEDQGRPDDETPRGIVFLNSVVVAALLLLGGAGGFYCYRRRKGLRRA